MENITIPSDEDILEDFRSHWTRFSEMSFEQLQDVQNTMRMLQLKAVQTIWNSTKDRLKAKLQQKCSQRIDTDVGKKVQMLYLVTAATLMGLLQSGFLLVEVGTVPVRNIYVILSNALINIIISGMILFFVGYAWSRGEDAYGLWGTSYFMLTGILSEGDGLSESMEDLTNQLGLYYFQYSFGVAVVAIMTTVTIGRTSHWTQIIQTTIMSGLVFPLLVHWGWENQGWMNSAVASYNIGLMDDGGSALVHVCGGSAALAAAFALGPRKYAEDVAFIPTSAPSWTYIGYMILMVGYTNFNAFEYYIHESIFSSTEQSSNDSLKFVTNSVINTLVAAFGGGAAVIMIYMIFFKATFCTYFEFINIIISSLAGQISICGGCRRYSNAMAGIVGTIGGIMSFCWSYFVRARIPVEDPVDAIAMHLIPGLWGIVAVCILDNSPRGILYSIMHKQGAKTCCLQLLWNLFCTLIIFLFSFSVIYVLYRLLDLHRLLRSRIEEVEILAHHQGCTDDELQEMVEAAQERDLFFNYLGPPGRFDKSNKNDKLHIPLGDHYQKKQFVE